MPNYVASPRKSHVCFDHQIQRRNVCTVKFLEISKVSEHVSSKAAAKNAFAWEAEICSADLQIICRACDPILQYNSDMTLPLDPGKL
jgi:hypothetical protein